MKPGFLNPFPKSLLTGLFTGIIATLICMAYDIFYRTDTGFNLSSYINVSSLIFSVNLLFLVIGIVHFLFTRFKRGEVLYAALFLALTVLLAIMASGIHRTDNMLQNKEFHQLFVPIVSVLGLMAALGVPFLYHNRQFEKHVL